MRSLRADQAYQTSKSWIDDLPVCKESGVGFSTNQIYREDGNRQEEHPFEDRSFHCKFDQDRDSYLYGVFDGHEGSRAVEFCIQRMPVEIVLGQLTGKKTDEEIRDVLRQAFIYVEKGYMDSINDLLAERTSLSYEIPEGMTIYEAYQRVPQVVENIKKINYELSSGAAAAIALVYNNKLFVANVGTCRVLLCQTDSNSVLKVVQLSVDHDLQNEDELLRLSQCGMDTANLRKCTHLGNQESTRCLGNYLVKGGYQEFEDMQKATRELVISEPDINGGIPLDESCRFLLLMSRGLYRSLEQATGTDQVNRYIAQCIVEQFREQATLTGVAQAVVDKVVRLHHDWYMSNSMNTCTTTKREDITLIVRNFNFALPNAIKSPSTPSMTLNSSIVIDDNVLSPSSTIINSIRDSTCETGTGDFSSTTRTAQSDCNTDIGPDQKIEPYVDFTMFNERFERAKKNGELPKSINL